MYPGTARARVCRIPLSFDQMDIPSVLFLTHYLPDDSEENQNIKYASLILGQNGIWGDLLSYRKKESKRISKLLTLYNKFDMISPKVH
jgi:alpha-galactosidase